MNLAYSCSRYAVKKSLTSWSLHGVISANEMLLFIKLLSILTNEILSCISKNQPRPPPPLTSPKKLLAGVSQSLVTLS